jgi:hypothetical protein
MNLFEQVALEELTVEGEAMTYNELRQLDFNEVSSGEDSDVETGQPQPVQKSSTQPQIQPTHKKTSNKNISSLPQLIQTQSM